MNVCYYRSKIFYEGVISLKNLNVDKVIEDFVDTGTKLIVAETDRVDISLNDYSIFLNLVSEFEIKVVFIHSETLDEDEIEEQKISKEDLETRELQSIKEKLHPELVAFNNKLQDLYKYIGEEQMIKLFFQHEGIIYSYNYINFDLFPDFKEDFLEEMIEKYENTITEAYEEARSIRKKHLDHVLEELKDFLINSDTFQRCTNSPARKGYVYEVIKMDQFKNDFEDMPSRIIMTAVDAAWQQVKLNKSLGKT